MQDGLSWTAIGTIVAAIGSLIVWMLWASSKLAVACSQLKDLRDNHLPHIQEKLDELLRGEGTVCQQHVRMLEDHEKRIKKVED